MIRTIILAAMCLSLYAVDYLPRELQAANASISAAENAANEVYVKWALAADLSPLPIPVAGSDPRPSELRAIESTNAYNGMMLAVRQALEQVEKAKTNKRMFADMPDPKEGVRHAVVNLLKQWPGYIAVRGK